MRQKIVAGNWKMNGSMASIEALLGDILASQDNFGEAEVIVFPPAVYLERVQRQCDKTRIAWGAQTMSEHEKGAYTGEISDSMLSDFGCQYVLLGHSERRQHYGESNEDIAQKFVRAVGAGLTPILCVGETSDERERDETFSVIGQQCEAVIEAAGIEAMEKAVIAYEPVWAIGTGVTSTPEQADEVHAHIRHRLAAQDESVAEKMPILYGGSVNAGNAKALFAMPNIDGGLVGGASLKAQEFVDIIQCIN